MVRTLPVMNEKNSPGSVFAWSRVSLYWPWALVGGAWGVALLAALTGPGQLSRLIDHDYLLEHSGMPKLAALGVFLACWQVMIAAMMAPSTLPILHKSAHATRWLSRSAQAVFLSGYFLIWTGFAAAAFLGDIGVHTLTETWPWLSEHTAVIGATTLVVAGVLQFTPIKRIFLTACRMPFGHTTGATGDGPLRAAEAWRLGLHHGLACLGSGWALMLLMFGVGVGGLGWMMALTSVMVVEKAVPGARWFTPVVGVVLLALAAVWMAHPGLLPGVDG